MPDSCRMRWASSSKTAMNSLPIILAFRLWIGYPGEFCKKAGTCVDGDEVQPQLFAEVLLDFEKFVLAENAVVDKHASEPVADGAMHENGCDRGVDSAGKRADGMAIADLLADCGDGGLDEVLRSPVRLCVADIEDEIAK